MKNYNYVFFITALVIIAVSIFGRLFLGLDHDIAVTFLCISAMFAGMWIRGMFVIRYIKINQLKEGAEFTLLNFQHDFVDYEHSGSGWVIMTVVVDLYQYRTLVVSSRDILCELKVKSTYFVRKEKIRSENRVATPKSVAEPTIETEVKAEVSA